MSDTRFASLAAKHAFTRALLERVSVIEKAPEAGPSAVPDPAIREQEVYRKLTLLNYTAGLAECYPDMTLEEQIALFEGTALHYRIDGEKDVNLFVMCKRDGDQADQKVYLPQGSFRPAVVIEDGGPELRFAYELEPWQTAVDAYVAAVLDPRGSDSRTALKMKALASAFTTAAQSYVRAKIMKGDTTPGAQAIALCGDGNIPEGWIGFPEEAACNLIREVPGDRNPNARAVWKRLVGRAGKRNPDMAERIQLATEEGKESGDFKLLTQVIEDDMFYLLDVLSGMNAWVVRYPVTQVPVMKILVLRGVPGNGIFITTKDMKNLFAGDFDGDQMFFTLCGLINRKNGKSDLARMPKTPFRAPHIWKDTLTPQEGQHSLKSQLGLRGPNGEFRDLSARLKKTTEPINGDPGDPINADLSVMMGFEQRNWVGIVTYLAWHLGWVVMNIVNKGITPTLSEAEFGDTLMAGFNEILESPSPQAGSVDIKAMVAHIPQGEEVFEGTTRREWAERAYMVVAQLLESCFDARKVTDTALAARLSVYIVACLRGDMAIYEIETTLRAAYEELGVPRLAEMTVELLTMVSKAQGRADGTLDLMNDEKGTGISQVWKWAVTKKSQKDWLASLLLVAERLGKTDLYGWMIEELSFEKFTLVPKTRTRDKDKEREIDPAQQLVAFRVDGPDFPDPRPEVEVDPLTGRDTTRALYDLRHMRVLRSTIHSELERAGRSDLKDNVQIRPYTQDGEVLDTPTFKSLVAEGREQEVLYRLHYVCQGKNANGEWVLDTQTGEPTEAIIDLPQIKLLPKKYSPSPSGGPLSRMQMITAQEGSYLFRPRLTNRHFGNIPQAILESGPIATAGYLCYSIHHLDGSVGTPWVIENFEQVFGRKIAEGILEHEIERTKSRRNPRAPQLASFVYEKAQTFLRSLEVDERSAAQRRVLGEEIELDFVFTAPGAPRLAQTTEQAIKAVMWKLLLKLGYATVATSKSKNGTVAQWKGDRQDPLWMAGLNPLLAASRRQRALRELRSVLKQGNFFPHPDAGQQRIVNAGQPLAPEFQKTIMECLCIYCDTVETTLREHSRDGYGKLEYEKDGSPKYSTISPDQGRIFPAAFDRLSAYQIKTETIDAGFRSELEVLAELQQKYPGAVINTIYRRTGAGLKRQLQACYNSIRPGNGVFKVTFAENVVKFMAMATKQQWYAQIGGVMVPLHVLASRQSAFDKDGMVGVLRAAMSLTATPQDPWVVEDNMDVDAIQALMPQAEERLAMAGIVDTFGLPSGRVPVYDGPDPDRDNFLGDYVVGWQTIVRTPHDDLVSNKIKSGSEGGVKHDPHVRHLGDIPFFENEKVRQQVNRFANGISVFSHSAARYTDGDAGLAMADDTGYDPHQASDNDDDPLKGVLD